jgi:2-hydroxychromene-2-carboxylate isomerase
MPSVMWYFDFVSPYAYLGLRALERLPGNALLEYRPILFAGLLRHFGQKGPAEIAAKRKWTYRSCTWLARQNQIPFRMPASHPFNPLAFLRLAVAAGSTRQAIEIIFNALWTTGSGINGLPFKTDLEQVSILTNRDSYVILSSCSHCNAALSLLKTATDTPRLRATFSKM